MTRPAPIERGRAPGLWFPLYTAPRSSASCSPPTRTRCCSSRLRPVTAVMTSPAMRPCTPRRGRVRSRRVAVADVEVVVAEFVGEGLEGEAHGGGIGGAGGVAVGREGEAHGRDVVDVAGVIHVAQGGDAGLGDAGEELVEAVGGAQADADREDVDEAAEQQLDAGEREGAAGGRHAEDEVVVADGLADLVEQGGEHEGVEGDAAAAGGFAEGGGACGVEVAGVDGDGEVAAGAARGGEALVAGRVGEHGLPVGAGGGVAGLDALALAQVEEVPEGAGDRREGGLAAVDLAGVDVLQLGHQKEQRVAVADRVVDGEEDPVVVGGEAEDAEA